MATDDTLAAPATETAQDTSPTPTTPTNTEQDSSPEAGIRRKLEAASKAREAQGEQTQARELTAAASTPMPPAESGDAVAVEASANDTGQPTIDPPAGYTADEKEWFKTLEPARQESLLRQYKGTQAAEARRANEHAEAMQRLQAEATQAAQERQQLSYALGQYKNPLIAEYQQRFADVLQGQTDLVMLSRHDPARFSEYQAYQEKFRQIEQTENVLQEREQMEEGQRLSAFRSHENARLAELMPELKTEENWKKFDAEVTSYALGLGISKERFVRASADEVTILHKAMLWDRAKAAQSAPKPVAQATRPPPKVLKPSNGDETSRNDDKYAAARNRARRTGAVDDVALSIRAKMERLSSR